MRRLKNQRRGYRLSIERSQQSVSLASPRISEKYVGSVHKHHRSLTTSSFLSHGCCIWYYRPFGRCGLFIRQDGRYSLWCTTLSHPHPTEKWKEDTDHVTGFGEEIRWEKDVEGVEEGSRL